MKVAEKIETRINKMPDGTTFKYIGLAIAQDEYAAAAKAIERLIKRGSLTEHQQEYSTSPKRQHSAT